MHVTAKAPVSSWVAIVGVVLWGAASLAQSPGRLAPGTGIVTGSIQIEGGGSGAGVRVAVVATDDVMGANLVSLAETDAAGHYRLTDIPQGHYYIVAGRVSNLTFFPGSNDRSKATEIFVEPAKIIANMNFKVPADSRRPPQASTLGRSGVEESAFKQAENERNIFMKIKLLLGFERNFPRSELLPWVHADLLDSYIATGDPSAASDVGEKILEKDPTDVWTMMQLSRGYALTQSNLREALRYGQDAVSTAEKLKTLPPASRPAMARGLTSAQWNTTIAALETSAAGNLAWVRQVVAWSQKMIDASVHTRRN